MAVVVPAIYHVMIYDVNKTCRIPPPQFKSEPSQIYLYIAPDGRMRLTTAAVYTCTICCTLKTKPGYATAAIIVAPWLVSLVVQWFGVGLVIERSLVQLPADYYDN